MPTPYYFPTDFECHVINNEEKDTTGKTTKIQTHKPNSYKYVKVRYDGYSEPPVEFIGKDTDQKFVFAMIKEAIKLQNEYKNPKPMKPLTLVEKEKHDSANECWVCERIDLNRTSGAGTTLALFVHDKP